MSNIPLSSLGTLNTVLDSVELVKKAWSSFSLPSQFAPTMNVEELDKRITDLKAVEQWLDLNLSMLRGTIQGLSLQRNAVSAVQTFGKNAAAAGEAARAAADNAAAAPVPAAQNLADAAAQAIKAQANESASLVNPAAWWSLLQSQFNQIAQATVGAAAPAAKKSPPGVSSTAKRRPKAKSDKPPGKTVESTKPSTT